MVKDTFDSVHVESTFKRLGFGTTRSFYNLFTNVSRIIYLFVIIISINFQDSTKIRSLDSRTVCLGVNKSSNWDTYFGVICVMESINENS